MDSYLHFEVVLFYQRMDGQLRICNWTNQLKQSNKIKKTKEQQISWKKKKTNHEIKKNGMIYTK